MPDLNYLKSILDYDSSTGVFTWKISNSKRIKSRDVDGCLWFNPKNTDNKYYKIQINKKLYQLHRVAYYYITGIDAAENKVDHINGNTLDNRFDNLRLGTQADNCKNRKENKNNKSGFKGVSWHKKKKRWRAQIRVNNKRIHLGYFNNKFYAAVVYARAAKKYFGEWRRKNSS